MEIAFANDGSNALCALTREAREKDFEVAVDPRLKVWGPGKPSEAKWTLNEGNSVTFTGPAEFLLGNVGRDAGTLTLQRKI